MGDIYLYENGLITATHIIYIYIENLMLSSIHIHILIYIYLKPIDGHLFLAFPFSWKEIHVWKSRAQLTGFGYLLPPCGTQASNSGYQRLKHHQPWLQAPWHTYPSHRLSSCYRESLWLRRKGLISPSGEGVMRPLRAVKCGPQGTGLATACRQEWWLSRKSSHASEAGSGLRRKHSAAPCTH